MSQATTRGVEVSVTPRHHPERSDPTGGAWFFSYTVTIRNVGDQGVRLLARTWRITDATGHTEVVRGPGVVGETPHLHPGEAFEYTSFCPLSTSLGAMQGRYLMMADDGERFEAEIAPFTLADPRELN